jgi:type I restriction-modification system DNA methylase subunit
VLFFERKPAAVDDTPWTRKLWIYDLRTNKHFKLKTAPMSTSDLEDFVSCYNTEDRQGREETERFRAFGYEELVSRDKANLDHSPHPAAAVACRARQAIRRFAGSPAAQRCWLPWWLCGLRVEPLGTPGAA